MEHIGQDDIWLVGSWAQYKSVYLKLISPKPWGVQFKDRIWFLTKLII